MLASGFVPVMKSLNPVVRCEAVIHQHGRSVALNKIRETDCFDRFIYAM